MNILFVGHLPYAFPKLYARCIQCSIKKGIKEKGKMYKRKKGRVFSCLI